MSSSVEWRPVRPEPSGEFTATIAGKTARLRWSDFGGGWCVYVDGEYQGQRAALEDAKALAESAARRREP